MFQAISVHATVGQVLCQDVLGPSTAIPTFDQDLSDWTRALLTLLIGFAMWHRQDAPGAGQRLPASPAEPQAAAGAAPQNCVAANICKHGAKTPDLTSPPQDLLQAASAMPEKPVALELESDEEDSRIDAQTLPELKVFKP